MSKKPNPNVLVGFGDWSNKDTGIFKRTQSGPVLKFKRELSKYCKVVSVDEYKTSKLHHKCGCKLKYQYSHKNYRKDNSRRNLKVHSVLYCINNSCNGMTMNRDTNASRNILDILIYQLKYGSRYPRFEREST